MKKINILTGPIQSGKTTRLIAWVKFHRHAAGILSPVIHKQRYIYSIHANDYRQLEAGNENVPEKDLIKIGQYSFLKSTFNWAREQLQSALKEKTKYLVIDEIGPLELTGQGLEPAVTAVVQQILQSPKHHLIIVVRDSLLERVVMHYDLEGHYLTDHHFLSMP